MNTNDAYDIKIADYLDDKMTAAEEQAFMQELSGNEDLRERYENELVFRAMMQQEAESANPHSLLFQPADEHIDMIESALEKRAVTRTAPGIRRYIAAAAVFLLVATGIFILLKMTNRGNTVHVPVANSQSDKDLAKDSIAKKDSTAAPLLKLPVTPVTKTTNQKFNPHILQPHKEQPQESIVEAVSPRDSLTNAFTNRDSPSVVLQGHNDVHLKDTLMTNIAEFMIQGHICDSLPPSEKLSIMVAPFTTNVWTADPNIEAYLPVMLTNALQRSGCFHVIERTRPNGIAAETAMASTNDGFSLAKYALAKGAQILITGTITEFREDTDPLPPDSAGITTDTLQRITRQSQIAFLLQIINPSTNQVIDSKLFKTRKMAVSNIENESYKKVVNNFALARKPAKQTVIETSIADVAEYISLNRNSYLTTIRKTQPATNTDINCDSLCRVFYKPYNDNKIISPASLDSVHDNLKKGNLEAVTSVSEKDIKIVNANSANNMAIQYLHLYKGIAYLGQSKTSDAIIELSQVMNTGDKTELPYYVAQWYRALTYLKQKEIIKSVAVAENIMYSNSPYKTEASRLLNALQFE